MSNDIGTPDGMSKRTYLLFIVVMAVGMLAFHVISGGAPTVERSEIDEAEMGVASLIDTSRPSAYLFRHLPPAIQLGTAEAILADNNVPCGGIARIRGPMGSTDSTSFWRVDCRNSDADLLIGISSVGWSTYVTDCSRVWFTVRLGACRPW